MNILRKQRTLWQLGILIILNVRITLSIECKWQHDTISYDNGPCDTTTIVCRNVTTATVDKFHERQVSKDCISKRCYGLDIHNSQIYSIDKSTIATKLSCKLYEITLTKSQIHTIANNTFADCPKVWNINLENNEITTTDFLVGDFNNLRILNLAFNKLQSIKKTTFDNLESLEKLYLNNNVLNSIEDEAFKTLQHLRHLQLNNNNLHGLSKNMLEGLYELNYLYLEENPIKYITPGAFSSLNKLIVLNLTGSDIDTIENNSFIGLHNLESLNLADLNIRNLEPGAFNSMKHLATLDLHGNKLEVVPDQLFFDLNTTELLDLSGNKISTLSVESFTGLSNLRRLSLNNNLIEEVPIGTFESLPLLENLQLGENYLSQLKTGIFSNLRELKYLNLSHNSLSYLDKAVLFSLNSLTSLSLDNNYLSNINYVPLLLHLPKLGFININNNAWTCSLLTPMLETFKRKKIVYLFNETSDHTKDNIEGIFCTKGQVQENNNEVPNDSANINSPENIKIIQVNNVLKELTKNISDTLNTIRESLDILSHNSTIYGEHYNQSSFLKNVQKDVIDIVNNNLPKINKLNDIKESIDTISDKINNHFENSDSRLEKLLENRKKDDFNKYVTQEQFSQLAGNLSKSADSELKNTRNLNFGLYVISVLTLILFIIISALLMLNYFQKTKRNSSLSRTRSEIELINALS